MPTAKDNFKIDDFGIVLNPETFRFQVQKICPNKSPLCIKRLSQKDLRRFGSTADMKTEPTEENRLFEIYPCGVCERFIVGLCFQHPLIFVKENIPKTMPYTCYDTFPEFLELKKSTIKNAGMGVFTKILIPSGVVFGPYTGYLFLDRERGGAKYTYDVFYTRGRRYWVNAEPKDFSNWLRYVNCARFEQEQNFFAIEYLQNIYFCTYRSVEAGAELFVWYGKRYAVSLNIPGANRGTDIKAPKKKTVE